MSKTNKGGYQLLDLSFLGNLTVGENYIKFETIKNHEGSVVGIRDDNFRNLYNIVSNTNNKKPFVITGLLFDDVEYKDILVRNVDYHQREITITTTPYITLALYNGTSIIIGYSYPGYDALLIEITGGVT